MDGYNNHDEEYTNQSTAQSAVSAQPAEAYNPGEGMFKLRDSLQGTFGDDSVDWSPETGVRTKVDDNWYNLGDMGGKFTLGSDNSYYGTQKDLDELTQSILKNAGYGQVRNSLAGRGVNVGYDVTNGNPILNGQGVSSTGMINHNGTYWAPTGYIDQLHNQYGNQYQGSQYDKYKDGLLNDILSQRDFEYNPSEDAYLHKAQKNATTNAIKDLNDRGLVNSTLTDYAVGQAAANLEETYMNKAYQRYLDDRSNKYDQLRNVFEASNEDYDRYLSNIGVQRGNLQDTRQSEMDARGIYESDRTNDYNERVLAHNMGMDNADVAFRRDQFGEGVRQFDEELAQRREQYTNDYNYRTQMDGMNRAVAIWQALGYATPEIAEALGVPENARTVEYDDVLQKWQLQWQQMTGTPSKASSGGGGKKNDEVVGESKTVPSGDSSIVDKYYANR